MGGLILYPIYRAPQTLRGHKYRIPIASARRLLLAFVGNVRLGLSPSSLHTLTLIVVKIGRYCAGVVWM